MKIFIKTGIIFLLVLGTESACRGQHINIDLDTILNHNFVNKESRYNPKFLFIPDKKIIRYNPISLAFGGLMFFYQGVISPQIVAQCPYEISCSNYSKVVIKRYGLIKGIALTSYRLMRCNRIGAVDVHPLYIDKSGKIIDDPEQYRLK
jgi:putative component of membrane protein insertase Oxa1/YidC/SpoIIIJ protein YidD